MEVYTDPIIKKYRQLIETAMPGIFKSFYQGDPIRIPKSSMPALIISKSQTRVAPHTNAEDEHEVALILSVIVDLRDEIKDATELTPGISQLYDIIEGREETTYKLKPASILNILRTNIAVDTTYNLRTDLGSITNVNYGLTIGKRALDSYAIEGQVEFIAQYTQIR